MILANKVMKTSNVWMKVEREKDGKMETSLEGYTNTLIQKSV